MTLPADVPGRASPGCAVVCRSERGRWRPQADDTGCASATGLFLGCWVPGCAGAPWAGQEEAEDGVRGETIGGIPGAVGKGSPMVSPAACWPDRTRFAAFLTSPPQVFMMGGEVRNGLSSAPCASGQASRATRAQRGCIVDTRAVRLVCGSCAGTVPGGVRLAVSGFEPRSCM
jgi:hypothetical protein